MFQKFNPSEQIDLNDFDLANSEENFHKLKQIFIKELCKNKKLEYKISKLREEFDGVQILLNESLRSKKVTMVIKNEITFVGKD